MDDANIPSLLSAPYLGYLPASNKIYANTRRFLLSSENPYYFQGKLAAGEGSPHTPKGYIWPLALIMAGLTGADSTERENALNQTLASDPGDGLLHESFDPDDQRKFTRQDFGWPNALFSEFILLTKMQPLALPRQTWTFKHSTD
jgi:meiotically up-regulated gene 157 (Mug157) protein